MPGRSVPEWIGKTPDAKVPTRVRLRVFDRHHGICHISGRKIAAGEKWECDHLVAIINGGEHRESNLAPALVKPHRAKTVEDIAEKTRTARKRAKFLGIKKPSQFPGSRNSKWKRKINGKVVPR